LEGGKTYIVSRHLSLSQRLSFELGGRLLAEEDIISRKEMDGGVEVIRVNVELSGHSHVHAGGRFRVDLVPLPCD
jgi:hypothetical protein